MYNRCLPFLLCFPCLILYCLIVGHKHKNLIWLRSHQIGKSIWELCCSEGSRYWTWYVCEGIWGTKKLYAEYGIEFCNWLVIKFLFCALAWHLSYKVLSYILSKRNTLYVFLFEQYSGKTNEKPFCTLHLGPVCLSYFMIKMLVS